MTKRDIIKFLDRKHGEKRAAVKAEFVALRDQLMNRTYDELGLVDVAGRIQHLFSEAGRLWGDWKKEHENTDSVFNHVGYRSIENLMYEFDNESDSTLKLLLKSSVTIKPDSLESLENAYSEQMTQVDQTFCAVITTAQQMKYTKEAVAYLKELGFDLSELENPVTEAQTALMVPVDTSYLFAKAA